MSLVAASIALTLLVGSAPTGDASPMVMGWREIAHPIHTTITTITYDPATTIATAEIRVFADDLWRAVTQRNSRTATAINGRAVSIADSAIVQYVEATFRVGGQDGRPVSLRPCGLRATADARWICLQAALPRGLVGMRIADELLTDLYADQVNVVMTQDARSGGRTSLLFTRGDKAKVITSPN